MRPFALRFHVARPPSEVFAYLTRPGPSARVAGECAGGAARRAHAPGRADPGGPQGARRQARIVTFTAHGELKGMMKLSRPLLPGLFRESFRRFKQNLEA